MWLSTQYMHISEYAKILNTIITVCILSTMKNARNHPIYWRLRWYLFHLVMGSKFLLWKIVNKLYYELSLHIFLILYPIQLITKPFVYWGVILYLTLLYITTPNVKSLKQNESDSSTIQDFCTSNMILSAYMYRKEYSGFLRKVGKLPRYLNEILHQFGANATVLMSLLCTNSVKKANCREKNLPLLYNHATHRNSMCNN